MKKLGSHSQNQEIVVGKCSSDPYCPILSGKKYQTQYLVSVQSLITTLRLNKQAKQTFLLNLLQKNNKSLNKNTWHLVCGTRFKKSIMYHSRKDATQVSEIDTSLRKSASSFLTDKLFLWQAMTIGSMCMNLCANHSMEIAYRRSDSLTLLKIANLLIF